VNDILPCHVQGIAPAERCIAAYGMNFNIFCHFIFVHDHEDAWSKMWAMADDDEYA